MTTGNTKGLNPIVNVNYPLKRSGFLVGNNPDGGPHLLKDSILDAIVYAQLDFEANNDDEKLRPYQLAIGVAEQFSNVEDLYALAYGKTPVPKELFLYTQSTAGRTLAIRQLGNLRLRNSNVSYTKLQGGDREVLIHRLVFNCYLNNVEFPLGTN